MFPKGLPSWPRRDYRLGHGDDAKRWLEKMAAYRPKDGADFSWDDVEIRILRREAESLILGSPPAVPLSPPLRQARTRPVIRKPGRNEGPPPVRRHHRLPPLRNGPTPGPGSATLLAGNLCVPSATCVWKAEPDSRTIRCRSTQIVFKPCSYRRSNATSPWPAPRSWIVSARQMRSFGGGSRRSGGFRPAQQPPRSTDRRSKRRRDGKFGRIVARFVGPHGMRFPGRSGVRGGVVLFAQGFWRKRS